MVLWRQRSCLQNCCVSNWQRVLECRQNAVVWHGHRRRADSRRPGNPVDESRNLEHDTLPHRKPVQLVEHRWDMITSPGAHHEPGGRVLNWLQVVHQFVSVGTKFLTNASLCCHLVNTFVICADSAVCLAESSFTACFKASEWTTVCLNLFDLCYWQWNWRVLWYHQAAATKGSATMLSLWQGETTLRSTSSLCKAQSHAFQVSLAMSSSFLTIIIRIWCTRQRPRTSTWWHWSALQYCVPL